MVEYTYYTLVDSKGYIVRSQFTSDPNYPVDEGHRLLLDISPDPRKGDYIPGYTKPIRIEPVPLDSNKVVYEIVPEEVSHTVQDINYLEEFKL